MAKQRAKQPKKVKVPANAPMVLVTMNGMVRQKRQELAAIIEAGQAYARSVRLDPSKDYRFAAEGEKVYAIEQPVTPVVQQGAEPAKG